jgi:uncharacterized membrane protein HdeD (DUF308 family)
MQQTLKLIHEPSLEEQSMTTFNAEPTRLTALERVRANWAWFVALGIGLIVVGFIASAHLIASTIVTVLYVGAMMLVGAVFQVTHALSERGWKRKALSIAAGLFYGLASLVLIYDPILSALNIALVLGALLVAAGVVRLISAIRHRSQNGWAWIAASAVATIVVGLLVLVTWPSVGLWLLGMVLAVDLIFQGWGFLAFGLALKMRAPRR